MSVVMPVRDGAAHVADAVADVLAQTLTDLELVVVDDGSTDATPAILAGVDDPRVRVLRGSGDGIVDALTVGLTHARGEYVARMDADDRCAPERLAVQAALLDARPDVVVVGCAFAVADAEGRVARVEAVLPDDALLRRTLFVRNPFAHGSVMVRRAALDAVGGYRPDLPAAEDFDLWCRLGATGRFAAVAPVLYEWRRSPSATSSIHAATQQDSTRRILNARWSDGLPELVDHRTLAAQRSALARIPGGADTRERFDELQLAIVRGLAARGHRRRAGAQLREHLRSRPGAWGATVVFAATAGRVTSVRRLVAGVARRRPTG